jgi:hypothetical protein
LDLLLRALSSQVRAAPRIVTPFVPDMARLLGVSEDVGIARLLGAYLARIPERAEDIEAAQARYAQIILNKHSRAGCARNNGLPRTGRALARCSVTRLLRSRSREPRHR